MIKRKVGAVAAWQNSRVSHRAWFFLLWMLGTDALCLSSDSKQVSEARTCKRHKVLSLGEYLNKEDDTVFSFLASAQTYLQSISARSLLPHFHPKLNIRFEDLDKVIQRMKWVVGAPLEVSLFRLWEISNPNEAIEGILCDDDKSYKINPHYGHKQQYVAWFSVLGKKELGRVFLTIVKHEAKWKFGFFHFHKWTHMEKDYENYIRDGNEDIVKKLNMSAYVKFSLAQKLLEGNPHFQIEKRLELDRYIKENISNEEWVANIRNLFPGQTILTADSVFASSGLGILLRFEIKKELSTVQIREHCSQQLSKLKSLDWFASMDGIKCSYVVLGEPKDKEGQLGSIYLQKQSTQ